MQDNALYIARYISIMQVKYLYVKGDYPHKKHPFLKAVFLFTRRLLFLGDVEMAEGLYQITGIFIDFYL
jgi:hypothetical protein